MDDDHEQQAPSPMRGSHARGLHARTTEDANGKRTEVSKARGGASHLPCIQCQASRSFPASSASVHGRYSLHQEIAAGGMATVHIGRLLGSVGFSRTVAIKRLHPHFARDPEVVAMFLDEARLAARINHPNVVSTLDVVTAGDDVLLVMEYVPGESLARLLRIARDREQRVPLPIVGSLACSLLDGLHAAHEATSAQGEPLGIVHRDVSPQNVIVGSDGLSRVLDFGVAKAAGRLQTTRDGQLKGKLSYMAPEQLTGEEVTRRTDVYASAVLLWEVLVGERLFTGDSEGAIVARVLAGNVNAPGTRVSLPREVDAVVMRGLSQDSDARYASAREMSVEVERALGLASPRTVADWMQGLAAPYLARRARLVAGIEGDIEGVSTPVASPGDAPSGWYAPPQLAGKLDLEGTTQDLAPRAEAPAPAAAPKIEQTLPLPTRIYVGPPVPSGYTDISREVVGPAAASAPAAAPALPERPDPTSTPARSPAPSVTGAALTVSGVRDRAPGHATVRARASWSLITGAAGVACVALSLFVARVPARARLFSRPPRPVAIGAMVEVTPLASSPVAATAATNEPTVEVRGADSAASSVPAASASSVVGEDGVAPATSGKRTRRGPRPPCSPPFVIDSAGIRRTKPACM